jgi:hypothetical protein
MRCHRYADEVRIIVSSYIDTTPRGGMVLKAGNNQGGVKKKIKHLGSEKILRPKSGD